MLEEHAVVVGVEGDGALLEIVRKAPCGLCGKSRGCGIALWGKLFHHKSVFKAKNQIGATVGDYVIVGVEENALLRSSAMLYGIPLVALLAGALIAMAFLPEGPTGAQKDTYAVIGALIGLALSLLWLKGNALGQSIRLQDQPVILRADHVGVMNIKCERGE